MALAWRWTWLAILYFCAAWTTSTLANQGTVVRAVSETRRYDKAHSLGDTYLFDTRDGWQVANVTDLEYKYGQVSQPLAGHRRAVKPHNNKHSNHPAGEGVGGALKGLVKALKGLTGIGKSQKVTITWYTGHDLRNPSCWPNGKWAPSDKSFVAALTQQGWKDKPKCFNFVELCSSPKRCVFVRVVDTCAGCAVNSKHVDLTKAAFGELADFDKGILKVQFRHATQPDPNEWYEDLWGPRVGK